MPPSPAPLDPQEPKKPDQPVDIASILLPKKDAGPNIDSAQRINAGALLAAEEAATLPKPAAQPPIERLVPAALAPEESEVKPLQTYKSDVESVVSGKGVSVVSIAAAEAERRGKTPLEPQSAEAQSAGMRKWAMIAGGALLLVLALSALAFVLMRPAPAPAVQAPNAPFITVDDSIAVSVLIGTSTRNTLMDDLQATRARIKLSVGLIEWLYIQNGEGPQPASVAQFLQLLAPNIPPELLRTLSPSYLLGVHSFEENQPFLLLQVESYETAYRAMLTWEDTLRGDLLPLFGRTPSPRISSAPPSAGTTPYFNPGFVDKIVENRDTRAYLNEAGDILLLWTFLGRNTVLVTTNEYTLREVLSRLNTTPVVPIPGQ